MEQKRIYMDHNATTPLHPEVKKVMIEAMELFGNPSSLHQFGRQTSRLVERARAKIASFINADPDEIVFVGSGSEANNTVLSISNCQFQECALDREQFGIVTASIEHPCVLETAKCLKQQGRPVFFLEVDEQGKVNARQLEDLLMENINRMTGNIGLVSIMTVNNETGTIQDIKKLAELSHKNNALFHTDAVQAVGKIPIDVKDLNVDFMSFSGHKIYGPKGIGVLYVKRGVSFCPLIRGGHQEKGRRAGTENTLGIIGLGKAIETRELEMKEEGERLLELKRALKEGIKKNIPDSYFVGHPEDCVPNTLNVSFEGAEGEAMLLYLDLEGIAVSTGSACASGSLDPSHVLLAMGLPPEKAHGSIRISLGRDNTMEDVEYVIDRLAKIIKKLRDMSTIYKAG